MALPSSGQLSLSAIRDEFGAGTTSNVNLRTLSAAAGLSQPDQFSDFYGLSAYVVPGNPPGDQSAGVENPIPGSGTASDPYIIVHKSYAWDVGYSGIGPPFSGDDYLEYTMYYAWTRNPYQGEERYPFKFYINQSGPVRVHIKPLYGINGTANAPGYLNIRVDGFMNQYINGTNVLVNNVYGQTFSSTLQNKTAGTTHKINFTYEQYKQLTWYNEDYSIASQDNYPGGNLSAPNFTYELWFTTS